VRKEPSIDKFIAAQDGNATFVIPGLTPTEDRGIFSGLLIEGLWGTRVEAFSINDPNKITSRSLGEFLKSEVPKLAQRYDRTLDPSVSPTFPQGDDVYFVKGGNQVSPQFPRWPSPQEILTSGVQLFDLDRGTVNQTYPTEGATVYRSRPETSARRDNSAEIASEYNLNRTILDHYGRQPGIAVGGGFTKAFWAPRNALATAQVERRYTRTIWINPGLIESTPLLIEFDDGLFAAATILPGFFATALRVGRGISALTYYALNERPATQMLSETAILEMEHGPLAANAVFDYAVELRQEKHVDPVLGIVSAYLYDSIGDIESIRSMASYFVLKGQPIPYDLALLAQLRGALRNGKLVAHVPKVKERKSRTESEERNPWSYSETPEVDGKVSGFWPWMRQGWAFLDDPSDDGSTMVLKSVSKLIPFVRAGRFTALSPQGGAQLIEVLELRPTPN
jgi:hypothetical protein